MSKRIDAPVELTDAEIALVAGGDAGVELVTAGTSSGTGTITSVGGNGYYLGRDNNNGFNHSHFGDGAEFLPPA